MALKGWIDGEFYIPGAGWQNLIAAWVYTASGWQKVYG